MTEPQKLWIEALKSGKYNQGVGTLHSGGEFCCLGVACDIYQTKGPGDLDVTEDCSVFVYDYQSDILPDKVMHWLSMKTPEGTMQDSDEPSLIDLNDSGDYSFEDIANLIEDHKDNLFGVFEA